MNRHFLLFLSIFALPLIGSAQATDVLMRQQIVVSYRASPKFSLSGKYFLNLKDNSSRFDESILGLEMEYQLFRWLDAGVAYRFGMNHKQDGHEFRYYLEGAWSPKKKPYKLKLRSMAEQNLDYFDRDYLAAFPVETTWRNRLIFSYSLNKKTDVYLLSEGYHPIGKGSFLLSQANYAVGMDYQLKRRHGFNVEVQYRDYFLKKKNNDKIRIDVAYKLKLGYLKPKKKKKKGVAEEDIRLDE